MYSERTMMKTLLVAALVCLLCAGCSGTREALAAFEQDMAGGAYVNAAEAAEAKASKKDEDELMWRLLLGNARSMGGESGEAIAQFDLAEDIFSRNDKTSTFSSALTGVHAMLTSENAFPYNGLGQERIFCCMYKALDYGVQSQFAAARTELNRAADHQENWLFERRKDIEASEKLIRKEQEEAAKKAAEEEAKAAKKAAEEEAKADKKKADKKKADKKKKKDIDRDVNAVCADKGFAEALKENADFDVASSGNVEKLPEAAYSNAYLSHLCGVFRWLNGDGGRNFIRDAARLNPNSRVLKEDLKAVSSGKPPAEDIWIYVEDGLCPYREEFRLDLPVGLLVWNDYIDYVGIALPRLIIRQTGAATYTVTASGKTQDFEHLENIDRLLKTEFDVYLRGAIRREIMRCTIQLASQAALGIAMNSTDNLWARIAIGIGKIAVTSWAVYHNEADVRCWSTLPKRVLVQRVRRPADGQLQIAAGIQTLSLEIPRGNSIVWIRKVAPGSPMVVKTMTFK